MSENNGRIPQEIIDEISNRIDIVDVVGRYVSLKKRGQNFQGLCPFHHEKTPSFSVSQNKQIFHCFGCGTGGNIFKFLMEIEHISFPEAVRKLADEAGVRIPERERTEKEKEKYEKWSRLIDINNRAAYYYQALLHSEKGAIYRQYLDKRGLNQETQQTFQLGGCLDAWDGLYNYLKKKGADDDDLIELGLVVKRENRSGCYDRFRDRLMFPIKDGNGRVIAFGGRIIDAEKAPQKYVNSPDSQIFHKGHNVYGLDLSKRYIREENQVIIVEGYMDVIACHQAGIKNVVAPLGTALTEEQVKLLMRYTYNFVTAFDGDGAGIRATLRSLDIIEHAGAKVNVLTIPEKMDPDEFIRTMGVDEFKQLVNRSKNSNIFRIDYSVSSHSIDTIDDKLAVLNDTLPYLVQIKHATELEYVIRYLSDVLSISEQSVSNELRLFRRNSQHRTNRQSLTEEIKKSAETVEYQKTDIQVLNIIVAEPRLIMDLEEADIIDVFTEEVQSILRIFVNQYYETKTINAAKLNPELSVCYANILMQGDEFVNGSMSIDQLRTILHDILIQMQLTKITNRYQNLLQQIGLMEKDGSNQNMEDLLKELEAVRQEKTSFEKKLRGDKQ